MSESKAIIEAKDIHRSYKLGKKQIEVLKGVDLQIFPGEQVFLRGASGAGKTTLLYTLAGLEKPEQGKIFIDEDDIYQLSANHLAKLRNAKLSYVFQNYHLLPELTALENVMVPGMIAGQNVKSEALSALAKVGLDHREAHLPNELSGGEQQRVAIARALVNNPKIIFADEPTGNLDSRNGAEVMNLLTGIASEEQRTLVVVTHDDHLSETGTRRLTMKDGIIID